MRLGPASETLDRLAAEGKRFDLAFLDADKTGYLGYYKKVPLQLGTPCLGTSHYIMTDADLCIGSIMSQARAGCDCLTNVLKYLSAAAAHGPQPHSAQRSHHCGQLAHEGSGPAIPPSACTKLCSSLVMHQAPCTRLKAPSCMHLHSGINVTCLWCLVYMRQSLKPEDQDGGIFQAGPDILLSRREG